MHRGTYGKFQIDIDASGTETILTYLINITLKDKPKNLKLYLDEEMQNELYLENNTLILRNSLSLEDVNEIQSTIIYWNWALDTGDTPQEIHENDLIDSEFIGKELRNGNYYSRISSS